MRVVGPSSEDEMVALFLRGELEFERFGAATRDALARVGAPDDLVTAPDLSHPAENALRRRLLTDTRAYDTRDGVFGGFPATSCGSALSSRARSWPVCATSTGATGWSSRAGAGRRSSQRGGSGRA